MQVQYDSFANIIQNLQNSLWMSLKIGTSLESKEIMGNIIWQGERLIYLKNMICPDYPDFNMHLNSKNWNWNWSFWSQLSSARPLISAIWQLTLCTPYRRKWRFSRYRTTHCKATSLQTPSILERNPNSVANHIKVLGLLNRET